ETAWETAGGTEFFPVFHGERQEVDPFTGFLGAHHRGQQDGIANAYGNGAIGLFRQHTRFKGDVLAIGHFDGLLNSLWSHLFSSLVYLLLGRRSQTLSSCK